MTSGEVIFVDTETTGLYPALGHRPWEVALITADGEEFCWQLQADLSVADPTALRICNYYARFGKVEASEPRVVAEMVARLTAGKHLVGAVPSFDAAMLDVLLRENGFAPAWHYHLIDVETLAVGFVAASGRAVTLPWDSDALSMTLGVESVDDERHTALGDARWARRMFLAALL